MHRKQCNLLGKYWTPTGYFGEWIWCLHCSQVRPTKQWADGHWNCPSDGCDGNLIDAHDPMKPGGWPRESYQGTEFQAALDNPIASAYFPLYMPNDPYELAKVGKPGRWVQGGGHMAFVVDGADPEEALAHSAEARAQAAAAETEKKQLATQPVTLTTFLGQRKRESKLVVGATYVVEPLNKAKLHNRGRACEIVGFVHDDKRQLSAVDVRYLDSRRPGKVAPADLYADGLVVDSDR